jgi:hypothetical protein
MGAKSVCHQRLPAGSCSLRTLPPDLGIGRHGAVLLTALRLRVGLRHRIISRTGRPHERSNPLEMRGCFTPSRDRRGALEERRRPFGDPFCVKRPVSEGRMALPTPFETKRKKAPIGALGRIQYLNVAEREGTVPRLHTFQACAFDHSAICRGRLPNVHERADEGPAVVAAAGVGVHSVGAPEARNAGP